VFFIVFNSVFIFLTAITICKKEYINFCLILALMSICDNREKTKIEKKIMEKMNGDDLNFYGKKDKIKRSCYKN